MGDESRTTECSESEGGKSMKSRMSRPSSVASRAVGPRKREQRPPEGGHVTRTPLVRARNGFRRPSGRSRRSMRPLSVWAKRSQQFWMPCWVVCLPIARKPRPASERTAKGSAKVQLAAAGEVVVAAVPGIGVFRYADDIVDVALRGKSLTSGAKKLRELGLTERVTKTGRHEFVDETGRVRAAWDPANARGGNHWHKFAPDGTPLNEAGRFVDRRSGAAHIPSK